MRRWRWLTAVALCGAGALLAARPAGGQTPPAKAESGTQQRQMLRTVEAWLECEECSEGQRAAVARLGAAALPMLGEYLRSGPAVDKREMRRRQLEAAYRSMKEYETTHPNAKVAMTQDEYVKTYLDNYVALYQSRAATALADIGGAEARKRLEDALQAELREDVKALVRGHLEQMKKR